MGAHAYHFFMRHAGYSYNPTVETATQGRIRCAKELAQAEKIAKDNGDRFAWYPNDIDSSDFSDERPSWQLWICVMESGNPDIGADDSTIGRTLASLGGVDFGRDGSPNDPYARVVAAELALEVYNETLKEGVK